MKVLIAVDGSSGGFSAVRLVGQFLAADSDQVALYYTPPEVLVHQQHADQSEIEQRARRALANAVFEEAAQQLAEPLRKRLHIITGTRPPRQGILLAADEWRADMIVVGARGLGPIEALLVGSVSKAVVHGSHVPVLVARPNPQHRANEPFRVLLACDGSESSRQAAATLEAFHWPRGTCGRVIAVIESLLAGSVPKWLEDKARDADSEAMAQAWFTEHEAEKKQKHDELAAYCGQLPAVFQGADPIVAEGHAAEQILKTIASENIDLVVMGTHGKGAIQRLLLGSTSEQVLNHAPCSVLLVRQHQHP